MNIDTLKRETLAKPSRVAIHRIGPDDFISVKRNDNYEMCMADDFDWTFNGTRITEADAVRYLETYVKSKATS